MDYSKQEHLILFEEDLHLLKKNIPKRDDISHLQVSFFSGCIAGIANVLSGHPLDTIKVRMQMQGQPLIKCFNSMVAKEGPLSLYKGLRSPLYNVPIIYSFYFGSFELGKWLQGIDLTEKTKWYQSMLAGAFSGLFSASVLTPIELVKCKLQMEGQGKKMITTNGLTMTKSIVKHEGIKGLYKGGVITILREVPGNAVYFGLYEIVKEYLAPKYGNNIGSTLFAGGLAGLISWVFVYPQDILKTRLQCDVGNGVRKYQIHPVLKDGGIINCAKEIYKADGLKGFAKGISACSVKGVIAEASTFLVYERVKSTITNKIAHH